jgi:UDP-4-amino-4-deoxy-L-arabinose formyltransferase/UDP-glucuronic acid dehydrogenase (UDP-4-keto-hexauronic acid decarboxylating)
VTAPRIGLLGSKGTTLDFLSAFRSETGHHVTHLITLSEETKASRAVAYYQGSALMDAARGLATHKARSYTLTHAEDVAFFEVAALDVLFVIGWERLVPDAVLGLVRRGVYGMHGSPYGLPRGRGRSPLNWSIIQGHDHFVTSLFRYSPGVDDGDVIDSKVFSILERDDIGVLHMKNRLCMGQLAGRHLKAILTGTAPLVPQPEEAPSFYPKRTPDDGAIDWTRSTQEIDRLIRAVAPPYPGAFSTNAGRKVVVEAAQPFERAMFPSSIAPGTVLDASPSSGTFVVKTGDGSLLVTRHSGEGASPVRGDRLESIPVRWTREDLSGRYGTDQPDDQWEIRPDAGV